jgi:hypothetical protein
MGEALGISKSTVQRVWAQARLKPHRLDRYMASDDPRFEEKAVLALADGATYTEIMRSLRMSAPTISRWKQRFEQDGIGPRRSGLGRHAGARLEKQTVDSGNRHAARGKAIY